MFFKFRHVLLIIRGSGTDSFHPKCLAVSNAGFAVRGMTTTLVKVLVGVCWLGIEICHQAVPSRMTFESRNVTDSLDHSAVNLIVGWNELFRSKRPSSSPRRAARRQKMSSIYLHQMVGLCTVCCKRSISNLPIKIFAYEGPYGFPSQFLVFANNANRRRRNYSF